MDDRSMVITVLCSRLAAENGAEPLKPREWSRLKAAVSRAGLSLEALPELSRQELTELLGVDGGQADRLLRLFDREHALRSELSRYEELGISVITLADRAYPARLKEKLGEKCPPLFYCSGDTDLFDREAIGYVGSRSADSGDLAFIARTVRKTVGRGYAVVSGGARGCDMAAETAALSCGGYAVAFLADSMLKKLQAPESMEAVRSGRLLLLNAQSPETVFHTGLAMARNRYIYAQSSAALIVRADYNRGGTWAGAADNLKHGWTLTLCRRLDSSAGNAVLIKRGAVPVDDSWDGDPVPLQSAEKDRTYEQMSIF